MSRMVAECVSPNRIPANPVALSIPEDIAFATPDLISAFRAERRSVFATGDLDDGAREPSSRVLVSLDEALVTYERQSRRRLSRTVSVRLRYIVTDPSDEVVDSDRCEASATDVVARSEIHLIENELYPVTEGMIPGPTGVRRLLGPVVAGAAAVVSAYLLFSLRNESNTGS